MELAPEAVDFYRHILNSWGSRAAAEYLNVTTFRPSSQKLPEKVVQAKKETFSKRQSQIVNAIGDKTLTTAEIAKAVKLAPETARRWLYKLEANGVVVSSKPEGYVRYYRLPEKNG